MRILVDTDICIDFLRGVENSKKIFNSILDEKKIGLTSVITEAELFSGKDCNDIKKKRNVEELLSLMHKVEVNSMIAKKAGEIRRLHKTPLTDSLIAATAILTNAIIYSRNEKHFKRIKGLKLKIPY